MANTYTQILSVWLATLRLVSDPAALRQIGGAFKLWIG